MGLNLRSGTSDGHREVVATQSCLKLRISEVSDGETWLIFGLLEVVDILKINIHTTGGLYIDYWV